jgi:hypothetical protein
MRVSMAYATKRRAKSPPTGYEPTRNRPRSAIASGVFVSRRARIRPQGLSTHRGMALSRTPPPETSRYVTPAPSSTSARLEGRRGRKPPRGSWLSRRMVGSTSAAPSPWRTSVRRTNSGRRDPIAWTPPKPGQAPRPRTGRPATSRTASGTANPLRGRLAMATRPNASREAAFGKLLERTIGNAREAEPPGEGRKWPSYAERSPPSSRPIRSVRVPSSAPKPPGIGGFSFRRGRRDRECVPECVPKTASDARNPRSDVDRPLPEPAQRVLCRLRGSTALTASWSSRPASAPPRTGDG